MLTGGGGFSQPNSLLTFVDEVGLDYGADTQGIGEYMYEDFTLPSQTQTTQSQASQPPPQAESPLLGPTPGNSVLRPG